MAMNPVCGDGVAGAWRLALVVVVFLGAGLVGPSAEASVQGRDLGLGIAAGDPSGISVKRFLSPSTAIDGHLGFGGNWTWNRRLRLHGDHLWHVDLTRTDDIALDFYYGVGAKVGLYERTRRRDDGPPGRQWNGVTAGVRVPIGLALVVADAPLDIFFELAPGLRAYNGGFGGFMDGLLGVRYYFP